jgi:ribosomal protein S18 acetylase RimI-like enzyme
VHLPAIEIVVEGADVLAAYASISISYRIVEILDPDSPDDSVAGLPFALRAVGESIVKDYDALPGNNPLDWPARFDVSSWGFLAAYSGNERVGGAVVISQCPDVDMLDGRVDLALLWDIRVAPAARNRGVGPALLAAAESWARLRKAREMKVETQNTNVPACRFYARHGFILRDVHRNVYPDLPGEVQLLWYKDL